jgi:hypothetical protein
MAIMAFTLIMFLIFSKKVKSRILIGFCIIVSIFLIFIMFQGIFEAMLRESVRDRNLGSDYVRILAAKHFLTDFFKSPWAYVTGNGMFANNTSYEIEVNRLAANGFYLGDIGLIGNYALYGIFFVAGVFGICIKSLFIRIEEKYIYIRYMFVAIALSLITGGGFGNADFICFIACVMYLIDISYYKLLHNQNVNLRT